MENQTYLFIIFILNGFLIGILFDIFRIFRKSFKTSDFLTSIEDIIFWILTAFIILYSVFKFNNGRLRAFIFVGIAFGVFIYILAFSKIFIKINLYIIKLVKKIFHYLVIIPTTFIFKILKIIFKPTSFIIINIRKTLSNFKSKLKNLFNKKKKENYGKDFT